MNSLGNNSIILLSAWEREGVEEPLTFSGWYHRRRDVRKRRRRRTSPSGLSPILPLPLRSRIHCASFFGGPSSYFFWVGPHIARWACVDRGKGERGEGDITNWSIHFSALPTCSRPQTPERRGGRQARSRLKTTQGLKIISLSTF